MRFMSQQCNEDIPILSKCIVYNYQKDTDYEKNWINDINNGFAVFQFLYDEITGRIGYAQLEHQS